MTTYIPLHVPENYHEAMLEHLLSLMNGRTEPRPMPVESAPSAEAEPELEADVEERNRRLEAAWPDLRADQHRFFGLLAERHGEYVPFQPDVARALGGSREAQNALISLTPRMRRNGFDSWPIELRQGEDGVVNYRMDDELARVVRRLLDESSS